MNFSRPIFPFMSKKHESGRKWIFGFWELLNFSNPFFAGISKMGLEQIWDFSKHFFGDFEEMDPGMFPKYQISKIRHSIHSEWARLKLNGAESCRAGLRRTPFDFFMGWMLRFGRNGPPWGCAPRWGAFQALRPREDMHYFPSFIHPWKGRRKLLLNLSSGC